MSLENVSPGRPNRSADVPRLHVRKCNECGQPLPERNQAPAGKPWSSGIFECAQDRESCKLHNQAPAGKPWSSGIFECAQDRESCLMGLFCPCVLFGRNVEQVRDGCSWIAPCIYHAVFVEGGLGLATATAALPCLIHSQAAFPIWTGLLFGWTICGACTGNLRESLQKKYHLENSPCDPDSVHTFMHWCAICQEHREIKARITHDATTPKAIVNPPLVQEMHANDTKRVNVEIQTL